MGFLVRWAAAFILAEQPSIRLSTTISLGTHPRQHKPIAGSASDSDAGDCLHYFLAGNATLNRSFRMVLVLALVGALVWVLYDFGVVTLDNPNVSLGSLLWCCR